MVCGPARPPGRHHQGRRSPTPPIAHARGRARGAVGAGRPPPGRRRFELDRTRVKELEVLSSRSRCRKGIRFLGTAHGLEPARTCQQFGTTWHLRHAAPAGAAHRRDRWGWQVELLRRRGFLQCSAADLTRRDGWRQCLDLEHARNHPTRCPHAAARRSSAQRLDDIIRHARQIDKRPCDGCRILCRIHQAEVVCTDLLVLC
mmetsp:Transcript_16763/g.30384  ORF Transcript_16763/g.30384 Transcript_16763/m.30384 type:complete len:202 (-) Transcript_16763:201-806(-)